MTNETTSDAILEERPMTTRSGTEVTLSVFDAGLPSLDYFDPEYQDDPHRFNAAALAQAPVVMGPLGPVVLAYDLVQKVLRDPRFRPPRPPARLGRTRRLHRRHGRRPPPHTGRRPRVGTHPGGRRRRQAQPR